MKMALFLLLIPSLVDGQILESVSQLPYTNNIQMGDEIILSSKDPTATTGYRTRRLSISNLITMILTNKNFFLNNNYIRGTSNTTILSVSNVATFGVGGSIIAGTNYYGGDGADLVLDPFNVRGSVDFLGGHQSRFVWLSNSVFYGMIDMQYAHSGSPNNSEMGIIAEGDIHIKPTLSATLQPGTTTIGGNGLNQILQLLGAPNGSNSVLQRFISRQDNIGNIAILARTNPLVADSSILNFYNPEPTLNGSPAAWTGGNLILSLGTNYSWLNGSVLLGGSSSLNTYAANWSDSAHFFQFGTGGINVDLIHRNADGSVFYWRSGAFTPSGSPLDVYGNLWVGGTVLSTNGYWFTNQSAPTAGQVGGTVGSRTNHMLKSVGSALIDYWSDGTTLYSKQLAP